MKPLTILDAARAPRMLLAALLVILAATGGGYARAQVVQEPLPVDVYVFHGRGCPHCASALDFLADLQTRTPNLRVHDYEIWYDASQRELFQAFAAGYGRTIEGVPVLVLGDAWWVGFSSDVARDLEESVVRYTSVPAPDPRTRIAPSELDRAILAGQLLDPRADAVRTPAEQPATSEALLPLERDVSAVSLPLLGTLELDGTPLLLATILVALVDGINPCSLWVLALLLGIVLGSGSRRRLLLIGATFLAITASVYALFIAGVFQIMGFLGMLGWMRIVVAILAAGMGAIHLKDYFAFQQGFSLTTPDAAKPGIYKGVRRIMRAEGSWALTLAATSLLALGVTLVELPCTAGFPVIWTGLLADAGAERGTFSALLAVYILVYLFDELVIFASAVITMRAARLDRGGARMLKLLGGMVMLALAITMLQAPEALSSLTGTALVFAAALAAAALVLLLHRVVHPASSPLRHRRP